MNIQESKKIIEYKKIIDLNNLEYFKSLLLNTIYPIGCVYISVSPNDPSILFGGTWERIEDRFLLASGEIHSNGSIGGEEMHTLTIDELATHSHERGTMNITGSLTERPASKSIEIMRGSGAFNTQTFSEIIPDDEYPDWKLTVVTEGESTHSNNMHFFDASKTWTGSTSTVGHNKPHNNMPPYLAVYMWKRIN
jgi:microcystin-dependent protein